MNTKQSRNFDSSILLLSSSLRPGGESKFIREFTELHPKFFFEIISPDFISDNDFKKLSRNTNLIQCGGNYLRYSWNILISILFKNYGLIIISGRKAGLIGHFLGNIFSLPILYVPHGNHYLDSNKFFDKFYRLYDRFFLKKAFVYLISFAEKIRYEKHGIILKKFSIIRNPILINKNNVNFSEQYPYDVYLFWIGRFDPHKNLKGAIEYVIRYSSENKKNSVKMDVYSTSPKDLNELNYFDECMLLKNECWELFLDNEINYNKFKQKYSALLFSSKGEGFSYVIAESMIINIPIIAFNSHGVSEVIGKKRGKLISSYKEFVKAIEFLPKDHAKIIENQKRFSKKFLSIDFIRSEQEKVLRNCMKR